MHMCEMPLPRATPSVDVRSLSPQKQTYTEISYIKNFSSYGYYVASTWLCLGIGMQGGVTV